jgi:bacteriophage CI repressor helix-turn-helix domain
MSIYKKVCDALGISRKELADKLGISKATIDSWSDSSRISNTAQVALELMIENHSLSNIVGKIQEAQKAFNEYNTGNILQSASDDHKKLVERMKHILSEFKLTTITAAKKMNELGFERLDKIMTFKKYPDFEFLEKFISTFQILDVWLLEGKFAPFDIKFIQSHSLKQLTDEINEFLKIYIVHSSDNETYTKIVAMNKKGQYDYYDNDFCIGKNFIMSGIECGDLLSLYDFYKANKYRIELVQLEREEYDKLFSRDYYAANILKYHKHSYMLDDLFDLNTDNSSKYEDFYQECIDIIKYQLEIRKKNKNN